MKAKVNTKSNYRNLNGQWLQVKEIVGTRVSCMVETEEFGKQTVDFKLEEVEEFTQYESADKLLLSFYIHLIENGWAKHTAPINAVTYIKKYLENDKSKKA